MNFFTGGMETYLCNNYEVVGILSDIKIDGDTAILTFTTMVKYEFPTSFIKNQDLRKLQGKCIGVLNIEGEYRIRKICDE